MIKITSISDGNYKERLKIQFARKEDSLLKIDEEVRKIMEDVKANGDIALSKYTSIFDGIFMDEFKVTDEEINHAIRNVDSNFLSVLLDAKANIAEYHSMQIEKSWFMNRGSGILLGQQITPINRVGVYVPGGKASYPSTVLMNVIPAKVAGVKEVVMVTPPDKNGEINRHVLVAAKIAGVDEIYKVGGAQAIAALAYGTETIMPVHKIVGPGNIYVARAKKYAFGMVDIDMIAGPSEICIIADENANPTYIAADLLSQAEHDEMAATTLITHSQLLAKKVQQEIEVQLKNLDRATIARKSIENYGNIFVVPTVEDAFELSNELAPEHLELMINQAFQYLPKVINAGAIFLGSYAPEPLGDYLAGPNHTLPTNGTAKFSSPLGVYDFIKRSSVIYYEKSELQKVKDDIIRFAEEEGLTGHANSIKVRF